MKTQFKQVRFNVLPEMEEQIQKRIKQDNSSFTIIIRDALRLYLASEDIKKDTKLYPSSGILTTIDMDAIRNLFKTENVFSHPLTELVVEAVHTPYIQDGVIVTKGMHEELEDIIQEQGGIQKGLIIPEMKERVRPDPDIKHAFSLSHDIRPGDGVVGRLRAAGIDPLEITKAKRNKRRGVEYDKTLEQYFDLL